MKIYLTKNKKLKISFDKDGIIQGRELGFNQYEDTDIQLLDGINFRINEKVHNDLSELLKDYLDKLSEELFNERTEPKINLIIEEKKKQIEDKQKQIKKSYDTSQALSEIIGGAK
ncbi:hypothetical protein Si087_00193 [Streptococcus infantarius subsp. infantarius]|nr:hypothetical protein [Streptococcus infantarius subsp. infantarius]MCO4558934.1 hypothetical protein [Streptococcus infantarius subsp. infantarius]MCO4575767.1 hypothetical protein [Streptococcus infantarius subsp. infantarius]